jgi:hypothetical protein
LSCVPRGPALRRTDFCADRLARRAAQDRGRLEARDVQAFDNGMTAVVLPDHRAPVVTHMLIWYRVGVG